MSGLLNTGASVQSDLVALVEIAMAVGLLGGMALVRTGRIRWHKYVQTSIILGNLPFVLIWMVPRYWSFILPSLGSELLEPFYLIPTIMLVAGAAAEVLGVYIILVAGTEILPERWRFRRYKLWMRTELALWWAVVVFGLSTYLVWYVTAPGTS